MCVPVYAFVCKNALTFMFYIYISIDDWQLLTRQCRLCMNLVYLGKVSSLKLIYYD